MNENKYNLEDILNDFRDYVPEELNENETTETRRERREFDTNSTEEYLTSLNERLTSYNIDNFENVTLEELQSSTNDIYSMEQDLSEYGRQLARDFSNTTSSDFGSLSRYLNRIEEMEESARIAQIAFHNEINKRKSAIAERNRRRLEIRKNLRFNENQIVKLNDILSNNKSALNDGQFPESYRDFLTKQNESLSSYIESMENENKAYKEEEIKLSKEVLDIREKGIIPVVSEVNEEELQSIDSEEHTDSETQDKEQINPNPETEQVDSKQETEQVDSEVPVVPMEVDTPEEEKDNEDLTNLPESPDQIEEEKEEDNLVTPVENTDNSENLDEDELLPVENVVQPKPSLWQKFKNVLKNAALFLITIASVGTAYHTGRILNENKDATYEDSDNEIKTDEGKIDNTPTSQQEQNPESEKTPESTPDNTQNSTSTPEKTPESTLTPEKTPEPTPAPEQTPNPTPAPEKTPEPTPEPTPTPESKVVGELATEGSNLGETLYNTDTGMEVTASGTAYQHNEDGTFEKAEDRDLTPTDHGTVEVTAGDLKSDEKAPEVPRTGDEISFEQATGQVEGQPGLSQAEQDNLLAGITGTDWNNFFNDVVSNESTMQP